MADSFLGKLRKILEAPKPPPHILERRKHQVIIPWHVRLWQAIRPPKALSDAPRMSSTQWRMLAACVVAIALAVGCYSVYRYFAYAEDRSRAAYLDGMTLTGPGDYRAAVARFTDAIGIWPHNALAYLERGNMHDSLGQKSEALADWNKAIELDPKLAAAYTARATHYRVTGNTEAALNDLERSIALHSSIDAYYQRGQIYSARGEHQKAIEDYDRAIAERREAPFVYLARAISRLALGDREGFLKDRETAAHLQQSR
ncbi:MAG: tetratricopeptide repeat protein [Acidobacteriota bacterium]